MSQYETVLAPDVTSTDDDAVHGCGHNVTLQYIIKTCGLITALVTTATFAFIVQLCTFSTVITQALFYR